MPFKHGTICNKSITEVCAAVDWSIVRRRRENNGFEVKVEMEGEKSERRVAFNKSKTSLKTLPLPLKDDIYSSLCTEKRKI